MLDFILPPPKERDRILYPTKLIRIHCAPSILGPPGEPVGVMVKTAAMVKNPAAGAGAVDDPEEATTRYLLWMDGQRHGSDISHYFIQFRTTHDQRWRVHPDGDSKF